MRDLRTVVAQRLELGDDGGAFVVLSPTDRAPMAAIASFGSGWDHVSVSRKNRVPNWAEMEHVTRIFFKDDEVAVQYHLPVTLHINIHQYCLHLWRWQDSDFPMPPRVFV